MAYQQPLFNTKIECPICRTSNEFETIKQGAYTESSRDTDFCPTGIAWVDPAYQKFNPLLFYSATCKNCHYTRELNASYKDWQSDPNFKTYRLPQLKAKHMEEFSRENSFIGLLGSHINQQEFPRESAIIKFMLLIFDEELNERMSNLDIARYFLRIAWLYREENQKGKNQGLIPAQMILNRVQTEIERLTTQIEDFGDKLSPLQKMVYSDVNATANSGNNPANSESLRGALGNMESCWGSLKSGSAKMQAEFEIVRKQLMVPGTNSAANDNDHFGSFATFEEFIHRAKELWNETPLSEFEAMTRAQDYYLKAYQNSREIKKGLQQLQAGYLIAELSRRTGNLPQAHEYFKITTRMAHEMVTREKDKALVSNARKILEMAIEQSRLIKLPAGVNA